MAFSATAILTPLSLLYGAVTRARLRLYESGLLPAHDAGVPVISVGNLTVGGTGKTPLAEWLARAVWREGRRVCVLSRGYGRADAGRRVLVSDGERLLAEERAAGDEPRLLAENLLGVAAVVCDANRVAAARWARTQLGSEVFILDDGFQHLRLRRALNIVTLDATEPWGGGRLFPRGRLREPIAGLRRADCVVITRAELIPDLSELRAEAQRLSEGSPVLSTRTRTSRIRALGNVEKTETFKTGSLPGPFVAFCALGNPQAFFSHALNEQLPIAHTRAFPDHHAYTQSDVDALMRDAGQWGAQALITTAKDAVKLSRFSFAIPCLVLDIELTFDDEAKMLELVRQALRA